MNIQLNAMTVELGEKFQEVMQGLRSDEEASRSH